jgi:hypothetical protein
MPETHPCQSADYAAVLAAAGPPIAADWLRDRDLWWDSDELLARPPFNWIDIHRFLHIGIGIGIGIGRGIGIGSGRGIGIGSGRGIGIGSGSGIGSGIGIGIGRGSGRGRGSGSGRGRGSGRGSGSGSGRGSGSGSGSGQIITQRCVMRVGQAYLIHLGDWHTFVGRVKEQLGPLTYALESASKVDIEHLGDMWQELCDPKRSQIRTDAFYWHYTGEVIVPLSIAAIEWHGPTPQEQGLPGHGQ